MDRNGWSEYEVYVVNSLDRHEKTLTFLVGEIATVKASIAGLNVKSGVWGAIAGITAAVPVAVGLAMLLMR